MLTGPSSPVCDEPPQRSYFDDAAFQCCLAETDFTTRQILLLSPASRNLQCRPFVRYDRSRLLRSEPVKAVIGDTFDFDGGKLMVPRSIPEQVGAAPNKSLVPKL